MSLSNLRETCRWLIRNPRWLNNQIDQLKANTEMVPLMEFTINVTREYWTNPAIRLSPTELNLLGRGIVRQYGLTEKVT